MYNPALTDDELNTIKNNRAIRRTLAQKSHQWFFSIYLSHYIEYPFAPFHYEMFTITEDINLWLALVIGFRNCGKSTLLTLSYPIWAATGIQQKKHILILCQTQFQAKLYLANIRKELETNELLKADIGPFQEESDVWGSYAIVLSNYGTRISVASVEQSIRGIKHGQHRPDLVILDDVEDLQSVKTKELRDKLYQWFKGDVLPIGDRSTKFVVVGSLLHEDSLLKRLRKEIEEKRLDGKYYEYPLLYENDQGEKIISWPGKFKDMEAIEKLRIQIADNSTWYREYLLILLPDEDQVVQRAWVQHYKNLPDSNIEKPWLVAMAVDPALSEKDTADFTAVIAGYVYGYGENMRIYIAPQLINKRLNFPQALDEIQRFSTQLGSNIYPKIYVEGVGLQGSWAQMLVQKGCSAEEVKLGSGDKRTRLNLTAPFIKSAKILFPEKGVEELINQLVGFGSEKHDDLVDAFTLLIIQIMQLDQGNSGTTIISFGPLSGSGSIWDKKF